VARRKINGSSLATTFSKESLPFFMATEKLFFSISNDSKHLCLSAATPKNKIIRDSIREKLG